MKRIFIFAALLISLTGFTQSFTLNELLRLSKYNEDNFDTYVTNKGYIFDLVDDDEYSSSKGYTFLVNGYKTYFVTSLSDKSMTRYNWISFQTPSIKTYLTLKNDLKANGYKIYDQGPYKGNYFLKYKKGNSYVSLWSTSSTSEYTRKTTVDYEITVWSEY